MHQSFYCLLFLVLWLASCTGSKTEQQENLRYQKDTIGFAQYSWQLDSVIARISDGDKQTVGQTYKAVICPHDDYTYAAGLFYKTLLGIKAKTVILVGVAHRASNYDLKDKVIFGSYHAWKSANGNIKISELRNQLIQKLKEETFIVHDSMMQKEHSLEAITPFLQKMNPDVEIVPMLVPYMRYSDMEEFSGDIAQQLYLLMKRKNLSFGEDVAIVISNDAIHYGNTDWGANNLAPFGVDAIGNEKARQKDLRIIDECLVGEVTAKKVRKFTQYTVKKDDYTQYQWIWCGRYSTPFGVLLSHKLHQLLEEKETPLKGYLIDYRSTLHNSHLKVDDLQMGTTAPANNTHWVGFTGISYY